MGQGDADALSACRRQHWLSKVGSPNSIIDRAEFMNERELSALDFAAFDVRR
jgi:hypothetical protein